MNGLIQVRDAVIRTLQDGGLTAVPACSGSAKHYTTPVAAVDVAQAAGKPAALCSYLGERLDPVSGTVREVYGRRLEVTIALDLRAPNADACESACESAAELILHHLPSGLHCSELSWNAVSWDKINQRFLRQGKLCCQACFLAESDSGDEPASLLDFILKGVMIS